MIQAATKGDTKTLKKLLNKLRDAEKSADVNYCDGTGLSALHYAVKSNSYDTMQLLLYTGEADVNMQTLNEDRYSPLHIAVIE